MKAVKFTNSSFSSNCTSMSNLIFNIIFFQGAEITIYIFKWTYSWITYSRTMDKAWFWTSCDYNQYNGVHLETKGWSAGKKYKTIQVCTERLLEGLNAFRHHNKPLCLNSGLLAACGVVLQTIQTKLALFGESLGTRSLVMSKHLWILASIQLENWSIFFCSSATTS